MHFVFTGTIMKKVFTILLLSFLLGCKKSDETAPSITVLSPNQGQVFTGGQTVAIKASVSDNNELHMVHVTVLDNTTNGHLVHTEQHPDAKSFDVNESFVPQAGRSYTIEIEASDHDENTTKKELTVSAN